MTIIDQLSQVHFLTLLFFRVLQLSLHVFGMQLQQADTAETTQLPLIGHNERDDTASRPCPDAELTFVDSDSNWAL